MSTTTPLSTSGSWFVCLFVFFFFFGSKEKIAEETILAMGFAEVCLFFFSFFFPGSGGFDKCECDWVCD